MDGPTPTPNANELARIRTHLANRRTLLAWARTILGLLGVGFMLDKFKIFLAGRHAAPELLGELGTIGSLSFALGAVLLVFSWLGFFRLYRKLGPAPFGILAETAMFAAILGLTLFMLSGSLPA